MIRCNIFSLFDLAYLQAEAAWQGAKGNARALAAGAVARVCSPEAAAKEGATTAGLEGFPIAVTARWLQNSLHAWLWDLRLCIFLAQLEEVQLFLSIMLQIGTAIVAILGSKDNCGPDYSPGWPSFPSGLAQGTNKPLLTVEKTV